MIEHNLAVPTVFFYGGSTVKRILGFEVSRSLFRHRILGFEHSS